MDVSLSARPPNGFNNTAIALQDSRFAWFADSAVYKVGNNEHLLLQQAIGSPHRATESNPFTRSNNVTFNGTARTRDFSNGELIRTGNDQTLPLNLRRLQFPYQGQDSNAGGDYIRLPWRMGLPTPTNSTCQ